MRTNRRAWAVMLAVFLASIAVSANRFKVPPVMQVLMADLRVDMVMGGWFMSVSALAGVFLAIPVAFLLTRVGLKVTRLIALGCTFVGAVLGALATDATTMLVARTLEGVSNGLIAVVAPTAISMWFEPQERGLPMGIWAAWVPVGNVIMFNAAHPLLASFGWRAIWWFGALLALVAAVVFAVVVASPPKATAREDRALRERPVAFGKMLPNLSAWLLALAFAMFGFSLIGYNTWAPAYLIDTLEVEPAIASLVASLMFLAAIPGNITAGWLMNRTEHRYRLLTMVFLTTSILFAWSFRLGSERLVVPYMFLLGFVSNFIPTSIFTLAPETMSAPRYAGLGVAIVIAGGNVGALAGPPVLGLILSGGQWVLGSACLVIVMGIGLVTTLLAGRRTLRREAVMVS